MRSTFAVVMMLGVVTATPSEALEVGAASPVVVNQSAKQNLELSGDLAVWMEDRVYNGLVLYDFTTQAETLLGIRGRFPKIDGTRIVYMVENPNVFAPYDIHVYDVITGSDTQVSSSGWATRADISGSWVGYVEGPNGGTLLAKNIDTGVEIILPTVQAYDFPRMDGEWAVYRDNRAGNYDVYAYDLSTMTEIQITGDPRNETVTDVAGGRVVFERQLDDGTVDIYAHDLSTDITVPVSTRTGALDGAIGGGRISGSLVVYEGRRNSGRPDVYLYDLATSSRIQVTDNDLYETYATVSGYRVMWIQDAAVVAAPVQ
ncbi:MAG: hypothetical protein WCC48_03195 [Anaeromyxobacteraceae bacterium]